MEPPNIVLVCVASFSTVFIVLGALAVVMRALIRVFPEKPATGDIALIAAVTATASAVHPGSRVTKVEETP